MTRRTSRLIRVLAGLLLLAACGEDTARVPPGIGARLPTIMLTDLAREAPISTDALRGTALVINFWATWCAPCRHEMPSLERLSRRLAGRVRVIGVTVDHDLNLAREFMRARRLTFPIYAEGAERQLQSALSVRTLPETVLVSAEGTIVARVAGARDWDSAEGMQVIERVFASSMPPR